MCVCVYENMSNKYITLLLHPVLSGHYSEMGSRCFQFREKVRVFNISLFISLRVSSQQNTDLLDALAPQHIQILSALKRKILCMTLHKRFRTSQKTNCIWKSTVLYNGTL
jgi:glycine cleavage system aminomethyltransferase T